MGTLHYGNPSFNVHFDDRALAHIQVVITAKLRRSESFVFSWSAPQDKGSGRAAIWLDPSSTLFFEYQGSREPAINRAWIEALSATANRPTGLVLLAEPPQPHS